MTNTKVVSIAHFLATATAMANETKRTETLKEIAFQRRLKSAMRDWRMAMGYNQQTAADKLGITKDNYQKYESDNPGKRMRKVPFSVGLDFCQLSGNDAFRLLYPARKRVSAV